MDYRGGVGELIKNNKGNLQKAWDKCEVIDYAFNLLAAADHYNEKQFSKYINWCLHVYKLPNKKTLSEMSLLENQPAAKSAMRQAENKDMRFAAHAVYHSLVRCAKQIVQEQNSKKDLSAISKAVCKADASIEADQIKMLKSIISTNPFTKKSRKIKIEPDSTGQPEVPAE